MPLRSPCPRLIPLSLPCLLLAAGCTEPRHVESTPAPATGQATAPTATAPTNPAPIPPPANPTPILGQKTQDIRPNTPEQTKGTTVATQQITAKDPITLQGNAYVTAIGKTSILEIQHAMDLFHATNDRYPKDYDEFMNEIIKANNITLPQLPYYQKYFYDENEHKLLVREYPH